MKRLTYIVVVLTVLVTAGLAFALRPDKPTAQASMGGDTYPSVWREPARDRINDSWGQGNRQCTSYAAWMLWSTYQYSATGWGDARDWVDAAHSSAIRTTSQPLVHSVAVDTSFYPGHVMWVEHINSDGTIHINEYNYTPGEYSERDIDPTNLTFIDVAGSRL